MSEVQTPDAGGGRTEESTAGSRLRHRVGTAVGDHQVVSFVVLAFAWTYSIDALIYTFVSESPFLLWNVPRTWGPLLAAAVVTWLAGGSVREWLGSLLDWRIHPGWYVLAFAIPIAIGVALALVSAAFGASLSAPASPAWTYAVNFVIVLLFAGALEEFGWRGFAQPRLQERSSALVAALAIGCIWVAWHLPLFVLFDLAPYDASTLLSSYLPILLAESAVFAALFNATGGSVIPAMVIHASGNMPALFSVEGADQVPSLVRGLDAQLAWWLLVAALVIAYGTAYLAPRGPDPRIPGFSASDAD